jgi:diguanylate cyclase
MPDILHEAGVPTDPALTTDLRRFVDNLLTVLASVAPDADTRETDAFQARIAEHRRLLAAAHTSREFATEADACTKTCEHYFRRSLAYHTDREAELTELIMLLREATTVMAGESSSFTAQVLASTERFSALVRLDDIRVVRKQIATQVATLKRAVQDKQERDEQTFSKLNRRVEMLQNRLVIAEEEASLDPLTRVANRGTFDRSLRRMIAVARRANVPLTLAMVDVDNFKSINDTHGHQVGDRVLLCAAMWLGKEIRQSDFIARYGGEEFAVVLHNAKAAQAQKRLTHVLAQIANNSYEYETDGRKGTVRFTVSCGLTELASGDEDTDFVRRADEALYDAKRHGKNRVVLKYGSKLAGLFG